MMDRKFHRPFSPMIMETMVPERFVEIINRVGDDVLSDDKKSDQWDWSHKLVGKVHKEVQIPISDNEEKKYLSDVMKQGCLDYLNEVPWGDYPLAREWYARMKSRPSFQPLLKDFLPGVPPPIHYTDLDF